MIFHERLKWLLDIGSSSDTGMTTIVLEIDFSTFNIIFTLRIVNFQWPSRDICIFTSVFCALLYFFELETTSFFRLKRFLHMVNKSNFRLDVLTMQFLLRS